MNKASEYNKAWRERNPEKYKAINRNLHKKRYADPVKYKKLIDYHRTVQQEVRTICRELKATTPCKDCKSYDEYYLMDFDHLEGTNNRSPASCRSVPELRRELLKVDIVCVRCHRIRTHKRRQLNAKT